MLFRSEAVTEETAAPLPGAGTLACMVTDTGGVDDKGFNQISYAGMQKAEAELGVTIDLLESSSDADYAPNLQSFADKGCNITVTVGQSFMSMASYFMPVSGVLLAWAVLGEPITWHIIAALACVIAGFLVSRKRPAKATSAGSARRASRPRPATRKG